ncbi:MAG TPA: 4-hydroxy-tetrahydrodipicolinate reductase [Flavisolibacter sp.]
MNIALIGYGKMGKMIEEVAVEAGHSISLIIDHDNQQDFTADNCRSADVAIEFTTPHTAFQNIRKCIDFGLPVVSGSTGWNSHLPEAAAYCAAHGGTFLHSSNFSIGVNIFFEINKKLAQLMSRQPAYSVTLREIHHTQKKDAPSGTAVTLAEQVLREIETKTSWVNGPATLPNELSIISERIDPAPGTHHVVYTSAIDSIEIIHTAHSRKGFAQGAVLAAEFIAAKKGVFSMEDVLQF